MTEQIASYSGTQIVIYRLSDGLVTAAGRSDLPYEDSTHDYAEKEYEFDERLSNWEFFYDDVTEEITKGDEIEKMSSSIFDFFDENSIWTDPETDVFGPPGIMQSLVNRRELYNDSENPLYKEGFTPLIGSGGSVTNLNTIHGKLGWHNQEVMKAMYRKPADLLIYYGWMNSFNSSVNGGDNEKVAQDMAKYNLIVFGDGIQDSGHGDYANTQVIIPRIKALNPNCKIFGYVTVDQTQTNFETKVGQWDTLGVDGIFMDEAGYDYGTNRATFNARVDYVHSQDNANLCFVNAWNMDHIIGTENDASYPNTTWNASEIESNLNSSDWYLLESFPINTTAYSGTGNDGYEAKADWAARGVKAIGHRNTYGINLAAVGIIANSHSSGSDLFQFGYVSACMFSLEAFGTSDASYGSSSAAVDWWTRPDISGVGKIWSLSPSVQVDVNDADVYWRFFDFGKMMLDFSDSDSQVSSITDW